MARHNPVDIDEHSAGWREEGRAGATTSTESAPRVASERQPARATAEGEAVIPIIEEELQVGKREVEKGAVRVRSYVSSHPVEADVTLREEHVHVERRPVDRPISGADEAAFQERTIDVRETAEEAVVAKERRVVEEVVVGKETREHKERVSDTVRKTEVDVDRGRTETDRPARTDPGRVAPEKVR